MPCITPIHREDAPRVTIIAGNLYLATMNPFTAPMHRPSAMATRKYGIGLLKTPSSFVQTKYMDRDAIAGNEQSTPPEISTIISPTANIIGIVSERRRSTMLFGVKNCPLLA